MLALAVVPGALGAQARSPWALHVELDMYLSLKVGVEYRFSDLIGVRGSVGACIIAPTQLSYTLVGVAHLRGQSAGLQVDLQAGLIQAVADLISPSLPQPGDVTQPYAYWVPGLAVSLGWGWPSGHGVAIRAGGGVGFGYDLGAWQGPELMPNLALEYAWRWP